MKDAIILKSMKCADIDEAAIFVSSPFQALCALEAINEFKVKRPVFYLQGHEISYEMTRKYLIKNGFTYIDVAETSNAFEAIKIHHRHKKFQYLFVGDYFSCGHFLLSMLWSKINATIVYLDDAIVDSNRENYAAQVLSTFENNVLDKVRENFGNEPNVGVDGESRVSIVLLNGNGITLQINEHSRHI